MFDTYSMLSGIKTYLQSSVPASLTEISVTDTVSLWHVGWLDAYRLNAYDAVLIVPGPFDDNQEERTRVTPIDWYIVAQANDADALSRKLMAYLDTFYDAVEKDPTLGGNVFVAEISDVDYFDPQSGAQVMGAAIAEVRAELDTLGG